MTLRAIDTVYQQVLLRVAERLAPAGFKRTRATYRKIVEGNAAVIGLQKSVSSTGEYIRFTVNLAVVCGALLDEERGPIERAGPLDGHLSTRLGDLMPEPSDKWWGVTENSDPVVVADEVGGALLELAVPFLEKHVRTADLIALWRSDHGPGANRRVMDYYLKTLAELGGGASS